MRTHTVAQPCGRHRTRCTESTLPVWLAIQSGHCDGGKAGTGGKGKLGGVGGTPEGLLAKVNFEACAGKVKADTGVDGLVRRQADERGAAAEAVLVDGDGVVDGVDGDGDGVVLAEVQEGRAVGGEGVEEAGVAVDGEAVAVHPGQRRERRLVELNANRCTAARTVEVRARAAHTRTEGHAAASGQRERDRGGWRMRRRRGTEESCGARSGGALRGRARAHGMAHTSGACRGCGRVRGRRESLTCEPFQRVSRRVAGLAVPLHGNAVSNW